MATTDPKTIIDTNQDPGLSAQPGYRAATTGTDSDATAAPPRKTVTIDYTDPPLYGVPELQIFNDPGGNTGAVQFNNANRLAGDGNFTWNSKTRTLSILGNLRVSNQLSGKITTNTDNFRLTGGNANAVLTTDGTGNLSWETIDISYGNSNVASYLPTYTGNVGAGNVKTDNLLYANGVAWTFGSTYSNSNVASYLPTYTGNVTANHFIGDGSLLTGLPASYANSNVASYLPNYTGNLNGANLNISNTAYLYNMAATGTATLTTININSSGTLNANTAQLKFAGGTSGQVLSTDGNRNVSWVDQTVVIVSDTVPSSAPEGKLWFKSDEGRTYVKYSNTWVDSSPQTIDPTPLRPNENNDVEFPNDAIFLEGRIYQDASAGTTSMRWVNIDNNQNTEMLRVYSDAIGEGNEERGQLGVSFQSPNVSGLYITSFDNQTEKTWTFEGTGNIRFPDDTVQTTAFQPATLLDGGGANANYSGNYIPGAIPNPFDQDLNTSDNVTFLNVTANSFVGNLIGNVSIANVSGLGNIATINLTGSTSNVLHGNGVFAPATPANTTTDNFFINGEGRGLIVDADGLKRFGFMKYSGIEGSLVHSAHSGTAVPLRIGRTTTSDVTAATVNDFTTEIYVGTNGHVRIADDTVNNINDPTERLEVVGNIKANNIGNVAAINLDGSTSNVLYGNGVFAPASGGGTGTSIANGTSNVSVTSLDGNITIGANGQSWTFGTDGNLTIPSSAGGMIKTVANGAIGITAINGGTDNPAQMMSWTVGETNPDTIISTYSSNASIMANVNGTIKTWTFDNAGNLTLPSGNATISDNGEFRIWASNTDITVYRNGQDGYGVKAGEVDVYADNSKITKTTSAGFEVLVGNITASTVIANIAVANVVGLGNIATINKDGNASNVLYGNGSFSALPTMYSNTDVASYLSTNTANVANLIVSGAVPSTLLGSSGDTAGMIRADSNYFYYCTSTFVPSTWTVGWEGSTSNTLFITKGSYPTPQVGWTVDFGGFGPWTIATVTDNGTNWQITWVGTSFGSPGGGTATLTNPSPATIWKQTPLAATVYSNTNATSLLASFGSNTISTTGNVTAGNLTTTGTLNATTAVLGNSATVTSSNYSIGYRDVPQLAASNTTISLTDAGKHYYSATAANFTLTIPNNTTTSFSTGTTISIVVQAAGNILVNAASGVTLYMAGNSTAANRYVNAYGMATLLKVGTDTWFINGTGVN